MRKMFPFLLAAALLTGCSGGSETAELTNANSVDIVGDTLTLSPTSNIAPRLVYGIVSDTAFTATLTTTGVVTAIPSSYAEVAAPFAGRVVRSLVRMGQTVKAGTPLRFPRLTMPRW